MPDIGLKAVRSQISSAAERAGRAAADITLIAVSKTRTLEEIAEVHRHGVLDFGENRVSELSQKRAAPGLSPPPRWHFIGRAQSRQAKQIAAEADVFHAVDREKLAAALSSHLGRLGRTLDVFLQVNVSGEASKGGVPSIGWQQDTAIRDSIARTAEGFVSHPHLRFLGLMTMCPYGCSSDTARGFFDSTAELLLWLRDVQQLALGPQLSMGMSGDFEEAIAAGATHIRVGSAIFGSASAAQTPRPQAMGASS